MKMRCIIKIALSKSLRMFANFYILFLRREEGVTSLSLASLDWEVLYFSRKAVDQVIVCVVFFLKWLKQSME